MHPIVKENRFYIVVMAMILVACSFIMKNYDANTILQVVNSWSSNELNQVFKLITHLGEGLLIATVSALLFFKSKRLSIISILAYLSSGLIVQIIKRTSEVARPITQIDPSVFQLMEGFNYHKNNSFPSGHTTSAFAFGTVLMLNSKSHALKSLFFCAMVLVGFSRIYLLQHFLLDVYVGAFIGILFGIISYLFHQKYINKGASQN